MDSVDRTSTKLKRELSLDDDVSEGRDTSWRAHVKDEAPSSTANSPSPQLRTTKSSRSSSASAMGNNSTRNSPSVKMEDGEKLEKSFKKEPTRPSKPGRSASSKNPPRIAPLLDDLPDATETANKSYAVIQTCTYQNKYLGYTEHAMECDCSEEWDSATKMNYACGDDSDCINRATKMECVGDCTCGSECQNQRFGRRLYANVSVIKTEKKGYGLRTNTALKHGDFIFEYIGEVIGEAAFRRRMVQYDEEGIKHFYFMSLSKGEFVDATRKGNLGRFCNHSCNPNCYVDKWVVGDKLRMGIFAERSIKAGEELVFNYNVDRYGANPQPCYCGEANCTGFIGGKTQTERATKLSLATIEALGIEDDFDSWDTAVAKKPKKKKTAEDDEDYVDGIESKRLDADGVTKVMAALMQCKEKWIAVRLLQRLQRSDDEDVRHRIVKLHGYKIMNSQLSAWRDDENIVLQILEILDSFPRLTRNKIVDAKIDRTMQPLTEHLDERVSSKASHLLEMWSQLELAYRIPRKARDTTGTPSHIEAIKFERRESAQQRKRSRSRSRSKSPPKGPSSTLPSGPRALQRPGGFTNRPGPPPFARGPPPLPKGWFQAQDESGRPYFYTVSNKRQWTRPTQPDEPAVAAPAKQSSHQDDLNSIISKIVEGKDKERGTKTSTPDTPDPSKKEKKVEKWRLLDDEKQRKIYENTLFPHISYVMSKYKHKIPKDDLKRFGKEIAKKLVNSDYKAGRVKDPTRIDDKQQKKVKAFCKEYFDKALQKHRKHEEERVARRTKLDGTSLSASTNVTPGQSPAVTTEDTPIKDELSDNEDVKMSDDELESAPSTSPQFNGNLKRKRGSPLDTEGLKIEDDPLTASPAKKVSMHHESETASPPPPPPPAPPAETPEDHNTPEAVVDTDIHADTNFKSRSMADVLAQAQQEGEDHDDEMQQDDRESCDHGETKFEDGIAGHGVKLENPMVEGQDIVSAIKKEQLNR